MTALDTLSRHLDAREAAGRPLALWWRDDDLETPSDALSVCLAALDAAGIAAAFAAVPAGLTPAAVAALGGSRVVLFVHGWAHVNHAGADEKKSEFGANRPLADRLAEIARGWDRVREIGGDRAVPCFVPPWNRIGDDLLPALSGTGIGALSAFASPKRRPPAASVPRLDTHLDLIDWRGSGAPISGEALATRIVQHDGVDGPVGILSHHRVTGPGAWADWRPVLRLLSAHPTVRWLDPGEALTRAGTNETERRIG
ncbi:MAG: polysaccharide deacetylase family protein [Thalassobaculaceae bacterium]